ncbi:MAG: YdcF family protein [Xanthobacteraceae bacterium]
MNKKIAFVRGVLQIIGLLTVLALAGGVAAFLFLAPWLQYQDRPERADYIVPLAGDIHRLIKAVELYKEGFAPKILLSNDRIRPPTRARELAAAVGYPVPDAREFRQRALAYYGVPPEATDSFGEGHISTVEEAEALKRHLAGRAGTVILVTSPYQARRAKLIFEHVMPQVRWLIVWPPEGALPERWWTDQDAALSTVWEAAKLLHYWAGGVFRANPEEASQNGHTPKLGQPN